MPYDYLRTVHFADTDAAGVVFFANYLSICHEAYEEALADAGINLQTFFRDTGVVVPISKSEAAYKRPLACGDKLKISVSPKLIANDSFEIHYQVTRLGQGDKLAADIRTEHVCISSDKRERRALPAPLDQWVKRSTQD